MIYKNKKDGRTIDLDVKLLGDWEPVEAPVSVVKAETQTKKAPAKKRTTKK